MKIILQKNLEFSEAELNKIKDLGFSIEYYNNEKVEGDIYIGYPKQPFNELENITGLKFIQSLMAGYDHLDMDKIKAMGITYANASGISSIPIAEYVILKILDYYKNSEKFRKQEKQAFWGQRSENEKDIKELFNKRAMVLGTGNIGQEVAKRLKAFEVEVVGINSNGHTADYFDQTYALSDVKDHLSNVDIVIGALPLNKYTKGLYNKEFLENMKKDGIFINVGRGPQIIVEDLLEVIDDKLAHVYLDVVPEEPLSADSKLWNHNKVSITPHISSSSDYIDTRIKKLINENIYCFKVNEKIQNRIV